MKKKILFFLTDMNIGGMEKSLLNLFEYLPSYYEITLLLFEKKGGFLEYVPKNVNVISLVNYSSIKDYIHKPPLENIKNDLKSKKYISSLKLLILYVLTKLTGDWLWIYKVFSKDLPHLKGEWDIAIAYAGPHNFISYYIAKKVEAKKRIAWIHFDVSKINFDYKTASYLYKCFDEIKIVSRDAQKIFLRFLPDLSTKTNVLYNRVSQHMIQKLAREGKGFEDNFSGKRIVTVGRLSKEKGQDLFVPVMQRLLAEGYSVRWYCIGEGPGRKDVESMITARGIQDNVILLGALTNPYPFVQEADIYLQTSRHEGFCITLAEAVVLKKAIVTTNFTGAEEQIVNGKTGFIVDGSEESFYRACVRLLNNPKIMHDFSSRLEINNNQEELIDLA